MSAFNLTGFANIVRLGSGGLGDVYRATRISTGGDVAIKILRDWTDRDVAWQRAQRELRALVGLRGHPNVVNVEEVIESDGMIAIVMEYAPGGSVSDLMRSQGGSLPFAETLLVAEHAARALAASHDRGIVHRDIKPHNLLIGAFGQVKVCDFGIAALTRSEAVRDRTTAISYRYASPEDLRGDSEVTAAADIYSLAATINHVLTGQYLPLFNGAAPVVALGEWEAPTGVPRDLEQELRQAVQACADLDPSGRPNAAALADRFEAMSNRLGPARCRALPVAQPDMDDSTRVRSVIVTGPRDVAPPPPPTPAPVITTIPVDPTVGRPDPTVVRPAAQTAVPVGPPPARRRSGGLVIGVAAVALLAVAGVAAIVLTRGNGTGSEAVASERADDTSDGRDTGRDSESAGTERATTVAPPTTEQLAVVEPTTTTTTSTTTTTTTTTLAPTTTLDPESAAFQQLTAYLDADRPIIQSVVSYYVPQLGEKIYGVQRAGETKPYFWVDILDDHEVFRQQFGALIAAGTEFSENGTNNYMTIMPVALRTKNEVQTWCNSNGWTYGIDCIARLIVQR